MEDLDADGGILLQVVFNKPWRVWDWKYMRVQCQASVSMVMNLLGVTKRGYFLRRRATVLFSRTVGNHCGYWLRVWPNQNMDGQLKYGLVHPIVSWRAVSSRCSCRTRQGIPTRFILRGNADWPHSISCSALLFIMLYPPAHELPSLGTECSGVAPRISVAPGSNT